MPVTRAWMCLRRWRGAAARSASKALSKGQKPSGDGGSAAAITRARQAPPPPKGGGKMMMTSRVTARRRRAPPPTAPFGSAPASAQEAPVSSLGAVGGPVGGFMMPPSAAARSKPIRSVLAHSLVIPSSSTVSVDSHNSLPHAPSSLLLPPTLGHSGSLPWLVAALAGSEMGCLWVSQCPKRSRLGGRVSEGA